MEKEFLPLEQALNLKKLGFNELCLARFDGGGFRMLPAYDPLKNSEIKESWFCVTPLYQQAFRFFREKYNLYPRIVSNEYFTSYHFRYKDELIYNNFRVEKHKNHYRKAESECLDKLIKIAKWNTL